MEGRTQQRIRSLLISAGMALLLALPALAAAQCPAQSCGSRGDVNCDGDVDRADLDLLAEALFCAPCAGCPNHDVNADGRISVADLLLLGQFLGEGTPTPSPSITSTTTRTATPTSTATRTSTPTATNTPPPSVEVDIAVNPDPVRPGEAMDVVITVTNSGPATISALTVESRLPALINAFTANRTVGAAAVCRGDGATSTCSPGEAVVWTVGTLAPGAGVTLSMPVSPIAGAGGPANGAEIEFGAQVFAGGVQIDSALRNVVVNSQRQLDLRLDPDRQPVAAGELLTYRLSFGNRTTTALSQGVELRLALPAGVTLVEASDGGVADEMGDAVEWTLGTLGLGDTGERQVVVRVDTGVPSSALLRAEAQIEDEAGHLSQATALTPVEAAVPLALTMELDPDPAQPGEIVTGRLTIRNAGAVPQLGVAVELFLPAGLATFNPNQTSGATAACVGDGSALCSALERLVWTVGTVPAGTGVVLTVPLSIGSSAAAGSVVVFHAQASDQVGHRVAAQGSVRIETLRHLELAIAEDFDPVAPGAPLTYRLSFGNPTTTALAQGVTLRMPLPAGVTPIDVSDGGTLNDAENTIEWTLGTLGLGQTGYRQVVVQSAPGLGLGGVIRAEASIADSGGRRTRATTETRVQAAAPLHLAIEVNPDPAQRGEVIAGRLTVTNTGAVPLLGVEVEMYLPVGLATFNPNQTSGAQATCFGDGSGLCSAGERLVFTVGSVGAGAGVVLTVPLVVTTGAAVGSVFTFNAQATENGGAKVATRALVRVEADRLLDLALDENVEPAVPGAPLTYRLSFGNRTTSAQAQGVVLQMPLPAGVTFVAASDGGLFDEASNTVEWMLGFLDLGQTGTRQVDVVVGDLADGAVIRAEARIEDMGGRRTRATTETRVRAAGPLHLTMELNPDPVQPGEVITGRLIVANTGAVPLLGVEVEMFLPGGLAVFNPNQTSGASATCFGDGSGFCSPGERLVFTVGSLAAGSGSVLTVPLAAAANVGAGQVFIFNAQASETGGLRVAARASVRVQSSRVLDLTLDEDLEPWLPGGDFVYRLSFGNGTAATLAQGVVLRMALPFGVGLVAASDGGVLNPAGDTIEWTLGTLGLGQTGYREVVVRLDGGAPQGAVIRAEAAIEDAAGRRTRATTETRVKSGVPLHLTLELNPDPVQPGETATGRLTVSNTGPVPLLGVEVEMYLPDGLAVFNPNTTSGATVGCVGDGSGFCSPRERIVWTVGAVAAGSGVTLSVPLSVIAGAAPGHVFNFNAQARETGGLRGEARGSLRVEAGRLLDLALDDDIEPIEPGGALTYRLTFGNATTATTAMGVVLRLPLPAGVAFVAASDGGVLDGATNAVEWTLGTIGIGQGGAREVMVQVDGDVAAGAVLRAEAAIADSGGRRTRATAETRVESGSPLELALGVSSAVVAPGAAVAGTLTVTNTGPIPLLGVQVEVSLPLVTATFNPNATTGAPAACIGDGSGFCSALERLVFTVGTVGSQASAVLTFPGPLAASVPQGRVVTFNTRAADNAGLTAAARRSVRAGTP